MAAKAHIRSNSFPSSTHPITKDVEEQLHRFQSSEAASTSSSSLSSMCQRLGSLKDLHDSVGDWLQLSQTQQVLSNQIHRKSVECLLDESMGTLDVCGTVRDIVSEMKGCIQELESSFRRKRAADSCLACEVQSYIISRKKIKKLVAKTLESLKRMEKQNILKKGAWEDEAPLKLLREVEHINISVFESLLCYLSRPKARSNSWSLVSKMLSTKPISSGASVENEAEDLDINLLILKSSKVQTIQAHDVQKLAEALESGIREIEDVLDCISRCLVKTRVSLLNIMSC
ncbi:hypothetical protein SAY87_004983 [Trapa incisa]|uniref:Uncharacterized protein n=1 Tax=Trapa incisa TaxID=236973 RepID=A0AAN7PND6_9MYRT|nr:hypothetical protein SAY87_004983 [Trapa incisa]